MSNTLIRSGAATATWLHQTLLDSPLSEAYMTLADWQGLPSNSRMKPLLTRAYASIAAFMDAWSSEGGEVNILRDNPSGGAPVWTLDDEGYPKLLVGMFLYAAVRISLAYSPSA